MLYRREQVLLRGSATRLQDHPQGIAGDLESVIDVNSDFLLFCGALALSTAIPEVFYQFKFGCDAFVKLFSTLAGENLSSVKMMFGGYVVVLRLK